MSSCTKKFGGGIVLKTCSSNSGEEIKYFEDVQELIGELRSNKHDHRHCWFKDFIYCIKNKEIDPHIKKKIKHKDEEVSNDIINHSDQLKRSKKHFRHNSDEVGTEHDLKENYELNEERKKEKNSKDCANLNHKQKLVEEEVDATEQTYEVNKNHRPTEALYFQQLKVGNPVPENFFNLDIINEFKQRSENHVYHLIEGDTKKTTNLTNELSKNETFSEGASTQTNEETFNMTKSYKKLKLNDVRPIKNPHFMKNSQTDPDKEDFHIIIDAKDVQKNVTIKPNEKVLLKENQVYEKPLPKENKVHEKPSPKENQVHEKPLLNENQFHEKPLPKENQVHEKSLLKENQFHEKPSPKENQVHEKPLPKENQVHEKPSPKENQVHEKPLPKENQVHEKPLPKENQVQGDKKNDEGKNLQPYDEPEIVSIHDEEEFQSYEITPRIIKEDHNKYYAHKPKNAKMDWTDYHRLQDIYQFMDDLEFNYPALCTTTVIGESLEGRPIKLLKISNSNSENSSIWIDAGIHAREWIAPAVATYLANHIVTNFHSLPVYLRNHDWYILPVMNPDGYEYTHTHERMWRKNKAMVKGKLVGVDLNRNFSFDWGGTGSSNDPANSFYRGEKPFSEPESFAVQNFILNSNVKFKVYITLHSYGQLIIFPFASKILPCPDYVRLLEGATIMSKAIFEATGNTYKVGISKDVLYLASGTSHDWSYGVADIPFCYLIELRSKKFKFKLPQEEIKVTCDEVVNAVEKLIEFVADWTEPPKEK